MQELRTS